MTRSRGSESEALARGAAELGVTLSAEQIRTLIEYLELLYRWNASAGLTRIAREDALRLHLLDCLAVSPFVTAGPCLDLGSGAGLPGLVVALVKPELEFVLVESNRRRCSFLLDACRVMRLRNVEVLHSDVESLGDRSFPVVMSRAFRAPAEFLKLARSHVQPCGVVIAMLADASEADLQQLADSAGYALADRARRTLPGGDEPRTVAAFRAVSRETPDS